MLLHREHLNKFLDSSSKVRRRLFIMVIRLLKSSSDNFSIPSILIFISVFVSVPNNPRCPSVFGFNLASKCFSLLSEIIVTIITAVPIPESITNTPITRPTKVRGKYSPYPTVVIIITAYQKVSPKLVILASCCLCSARYTPIPPKIRINIARVAGITKPMFVFRNV